MGILGLFLRIDEFCKILLKLRKSIFGKLRTVTQDKLATQPTV